MNDMLASRVAHTKQSITMLISARGQELRSKGINIIDFSIGEPQFNTPDYVKQGAIEAITQNKTKYTPCGGIVELKQEICTKLQKENNLEYKPEEILVSCGAKHSLYNIFSALIDEGDEVLIQTPYWASYPDQVKLLGGIPIFVNCDDNFRIDIQDLIKKITLKTKLLIINSPSNPSGVVLTDAELEKIADVLIKYNLLCISDEIYEKIIYDGKKHRSIATISPEVKKLILVVNGVSKAYSMTGWRIGYTAGPKYIIDAMNKIQSQSTSNPTSISQWAAYHALKGDTIFSDYCRDILENCRNLIVSLIRSIEIVNCMVPEGAFYVLIDVSKLYNDKITNSEELCDKLLSEAHITCVPGSEFGVPNHIRLSYATTIENIYAGIKKLDDWIFTNYKLNEATSKRNENIQSISFS